MFRRFFASADTPDVLWNKGVILVRRSHTLGCEIMDMTKTKLDQRISVPADVVAVLQWHLDTQLTTSEQQAAELLFPSKAGTFRSESSLKKPFAAVCEAIGLTQHFTPRGLRRTFNDLARRAKVSSLVTKSISGHATDRMEEHYSTVSETEQRNGIEALLQRVKPILPTEDADRDGLATREGGTPPSQVGAPLGAPGGGVGAPDGSDLH